MTEHLSGDQDVLDSIPLKSFEPFALLHDKGPFITKSRKYISTFQIKEAAQNPKTSLFAKMA